MRKKYILISIILPLLIIPFASGEDTIRLPLRKFKYYDRFEDLKVILKAALDASVKKYGPYKTVFIEEKMSAKRLIYLLEKGEKIDVFWKNADNKLAKKLRAIKFPLRKGLLGYRIFFIGKGSQHKFSKVQSIKDLKKMTLAQKHDWFDIQVYEHNGFKVHKLSNYESLFKMVSRGRFDYFPRGLNEVYKEYESRKEKLPNLKIEEKLILYYPWPYYFYVNKKNEKLANRIKDGLLEIKKTGVFEKIFMKYHRKSIDKANLSSRKIFRIKNPFLPEDTPLEDKDLWYSP